ncbi:hypothetical protein PAXINDRAFT_8435 [Paxillus involutus ATCC 200175]|nr:hypothetical protein PAXINDRAFT_8435 [Paxillus involutus ATCC 200175]
MGDATSSTSCDSSRVETGALAEHEDVHFPTPPSDLLTTSTRHAAEDASRRHLPASAEPERTGTCTKSDGHADHLPAQPDATETVRSYRGSVPEPPQSMTKGTEARMSIPHTIDTTHSPTSRELPYRVITPA